MYIKYNDKQKQFNTNIDWNDVLAEVASHLLTNDFTIFKTLKFDVFNTLSFIITKISLLSCHMENYFDCLIDGHFEEELIKYQELRDKKEVGFSSNNTIASPIETLQNQDFKNKIKRNKNLREPTNQKTEEQEKLIFNHGHWSTEQNKLYHWFLEIHYRHFVNKLMRRLDKIFKVMETFVGTRQAQQCRSHHQKMQKKHHNFINIITSLRKLHYNDLSPILIEEDLKTKNIQFGQGLATIQLLVLLQDSKEFSKDLSPIPSPYSYSNSIFSQKSKQHQSERELATGIKFQSQEEKQQEKQESKNELNLNMLEDSCLNMGWLAISSQKQEQSCIFNSLLFDKL